MVQADKNRQIARNTILLYFRMILVMAITFYTSRIVLQQLGVNDYGVYNVVGGIVSMFSILSASLSSAISRFLSFELGRNNDERLRIVFSSSVIIQGVLALIIALLVETGGVWFLNCKMNIAPERLVAANWVLQCSVVTFIINMLSVPYNSAIIAHEEMKAFAYVSLLEVTMKLGVAFLLYVKFFDSLIVYAVALTVAALVIRLTYCAYCKSHFSECVIERKFDKKVLKEMLSFTGWNAIGSSASILRDQGVNIVMNLFYGTAVNAARGIAVQVNQAVFSFCQNFMLAVNPQIIKSYASDEREYMFNLAFRSSRFSYYLLLCISLPLMLEMPWVLGMWLTTVPKYSAIFTVLILILSLIDSLSIPLQFINQATGRVKVYQIVVGGIQMLNFPLSYVLLRIGMAPYSVFVLSIVLAIVCMGARLLILKRLVALDISDFCSEVLARVGLVTLAASLLSVMAILGFAPVTPVGKFMVMMLGLISACMSAFYIGCTSNERDFVINKFSMLMSKIKKHA